MFIYLGRLKNIDDLHSSRSQFEGVKRHQIQIAVIDDDTFPRIDALQRHNFSFTHFRDIENVQAVSAYPVVLCDIRGVGKHFSSPFEGAHIISEIRKHDPGKIIIAFTAQAFDPSYNHYMSMADRSLKKDAGIDEWVEILDHAIKELTDPVFQWKRLRRYLLDNNVPTFAVALLESEFVTAVKKGSKDFPSPKSLSLIGEGLKVVVKEFASTVFKHLIIG